MAQNTAINISNNSNYQDISFKKATVTASATAIDAGNVNSRAVKNFAKLHQQATELKWFTENDCIVAFFKTKDGSCRRYYDSKGNFICNILSCQEAYLPGNVIDLVKSTYYLDYHIISAEEIATTTKKFYFIFIENKHTWKKLMVYDDEIEVVNECFN